ncbi:MAG: hypothetical protein RJA19_586 [Bacteroidota bacterium]|jgi:hypothetical protein
MIIAFNSRPTKTNQAYPLVVFFLSLFCSTFFSHHVTAQPDLLDALNEDLEEPSFPVAATFKDTRIVNGQSNETPAGGVLHFVIAHRFGKINEGAYALWGLDNATMRMAFDYGVTDRLAVGVARNTLGKTYEANFKWRMLRQTTGGRSFPFSATWYSVMMCDGLRWENPDRQNYFSSRLSYVHQLVLTRKVNDDLSLALTPSFLHTNLVATSADAHDRWALGVGGRYKLTQRFSLNGEYFYSLDRPDAYHNGLSLGVDIETGGHVFQLHVTNARAMFERGFIFETPGSWTAGDLYFGFNLSRVFTVRSRD